MTIDGSPIEYCAQFDERFHRPCALELSGLRIGTDSTYEEAGAAMQDCVTNAPTRLLTESCLYNISSSYTRHEIKKTDGVHFQAWVVDLDEGLRRIYLAGVGHEVAEHNNSGHYINTENFCNSFPTTEEVALCARQVYSYQPLF